MLVRFLFFRLGGYAALLLIKETSDKEKMKIIIDTKIAETVLVRIVAPIVIMWLSIAIGHIVANNKKISEYCSRVKRMSSKDSIHALFSEISINIIVSSILFVLLYNLLTYIRYSNNI